MTMTTPGFTAEASVYRADGCYRQIPMALAVAPELGLAQDGLAIYGNWCGPGHGEADHLSIRWIVCVVCTTSGYDERGYFDCSCDRDLIGRMPAAIADPRTSPAGQAAGTAAAFSLRRFLVSATLSVSRSLDAPVRRCPRSRS
jgi:hypothetical protein